MLLLSEQVLRWTKDGLLLIPLRLFPGRPLPHVQLRKSRVIAAWRAVLLGAWRPERAKPPWLVAPPLVSSSAGRRTHQNLLLALTGSLAQSFMRYTVGSGSFSVGRWRPTT